MSAVLLVWNCFLKRRSLEAKAAEHDRSPLFAHPGVLSTEWCLCTTVSYATRTITQGERCLAVNFLENVTQRAFTVCKGLHSRGHAWPDTEVRADDKRQSLKRKGIDPPTGRMPLRLWPTTNGNKFVHELQWWDFFRWESP